MVTPKVWNGTAWVDKTTKADYSYWNGTAWTEPTDVRVWNGSTWETIFPSAPSGVVAYRDSATATAASANSINVTIPATTQVGDLLVLIVAQNSNAVTVFNAISGWTKQGERRAGSAAHTLAVFTRLAQSGDAGSTVTSTSVNIDHMAAQVRVYSNVNQTTPLDTAVAFDQVDPAATSGNAPAVTVATTGSLIVTVFSLPTTANTTLGAADWTAPSGFADELVICTATTNNNACIASYNQANVSPGSLGPFTATTTQSRRWSTATITIRPA